MSFIRSAPFFRAYRFLPHALINGAAARLTRARRPRTLVDLAVRAWIRRDAIDMSDFDGGPFATVEDFFLRRLRPGARPLHEGVVASADGRVVAAGTIDRDTILQVKGVPLSIDRLVNGVRPTAPPLALEAYDGGTYITTFLSPRGYHFVHAPIDGELVDARWIAGRWFPQNEDALRHIPGIYERNERAVLRVRLPAANGDAARHRELLMVLVGASVIGSIELHGMSRERWVGPRPFSLARPVRKGDELGHFTFGSTVVLLLPRGMAKSELPPIGRDVRMGEALVSCA